MFCALIVVSGVALFLGGMISGAALLMLLEREPPSDVPPICDDP